MTTKREEKQIGIKLGLETPRMSSLIGWERMGFGGRHCGFRVSAAHGLTASGLNPRMSLWATRRGCKHMPTLTRWSFTTMPPILFEKLWQEKNSIIFTPYKTFIGSVRLYIIKPFMSFHFSFLLSTASCHKPAPNPHVASSAVRRSTKQSYLLIKTLMHSAVWAWPLHH